MISLLLKIALLFVPVSALASEVGQEKHWNSVKSSYFVLKSNSQCTSGCDSEYIRCTKKGTGKDMKQCSDQRTVCYRQCSAAAFRSDCKQGCESSYLACAKTKGKDMKQCSNERKACYHRCP